MERPLVLEAEGVTVATARYDGEGRPGSPCNISRH